jgi:acetyl esterase/lipase
MIMNTLSNSRTRRSPSRIAATSIAVAVCLSGAAACSSGSSTSASAAPSSTTTQPKVLHSYPHLTVDSTFGAVLDSPAFAGFSAYMVPTEDTKQTAALKGVTIKVAAPIIGWKDPQTMADGLNFMIDEVNAGEQMWHPLYSQTEITADASKKAAGLWFIPGDPSKPLVVIAAGGAFRAVESIQEAFPHAQALHALGYNVVVLKYRVSPATGQGSGGQGTMSPAEEQADEDMVAAMKLVKANAKAWNVSFDNYSVWGSSAGGMIMSAWAADGANSAKANGFAEPAMVVNAYTPPQEIKASASLPPYFITNAADDKVVDPAGIDAEVAQFKAAGVVFEYEKYPSGGHGFGLGTGTSAAGWFDKAIAFWQAHMK